MQRCEATHKTTEETCAEQEKTIRQDIQNGFLTVAANLRIFHQPRISRAFCRSVSPPQP